MEDRGPQLRAVAASLYALTLLALLLRCYVRLAIVKAFGPDDWMMLVAMVWFRARSDMSAQGHRRY